MNQKTKIEFYENRTLSERFLVTIDFIRQNWKILLKNTMYIGVPLIILYGFFLQNLLQETLTNINFLENYTNTYLISNAGVVFLSALLSLFFFSIVGSILNRYAKGSLTDGIGWSDLKSDVFPIMWKIFMQYLIIMLTFILLAALMGVLIYVFSFTSRFLSTILIALIFIAFFASMLIAFPVFSLAPYVVIFENSSAWQGIKKGFKAGFKHWGSTFLTVFLGGLFLFALYYILSMPYFVYSMLHMGGGGLLGYILAILSSFALFIIYTIFYIFVSFQYTSIVAKDKSISSQDIDNL
jgi:hypothetical protein